MKDCLTQPQKIQLLDNSSDFPDKELRDCFNCIHSYAECMSPKYRELSEIQKSEHLRKNGKDGAPCDFFEVNINSKFLFFSPDSDEGIAQQENAHAGLIILDFK